MTDPSDARAQPSRRRDMPPAALGRRVGRAPREPARSRPGGCAAPAGRRPRPASGTLREHNLSLVLAAGARRPRAGVPRRRRRAAPGSPGRPSRRWSTGSWRPGWSPSSPRSRRPRAGRPAVPLVAARGTIAAVGLEVNVDYLGVRALDLAGGRARRAGRGRRLPARATRRRPRPARDARGGGRRRAERRRRPAGRDRARAARARRPGHRSAAASRRTSGWRDVDVVGLLAEHPVLAGLPPLLGNEANLAARAEAYARRHEGPSSFVVRLGRGRRRRRDRARRRDLPRSARLERRDRAHGPRGAGATPASGPDASRPTPGRTRSWSPRASTRARRCPCCSTPPRRASRRPCARWPPPARRSGRRWPTSSTSSTWATSSSAGPTRRSRGTSTRPVRDGLRRRVLTAPWSPGAGRGRARRAGTRR